VISRIQVAPDHLNCRPLGAHESASLNISSSIMTPAVGKASGGTDGLWRMVNGPVAIGDLSRPGRARGFSTGAPDPAAPAPRVAPHILHPRSAGLGRVIVGVGDPTLAT
jgi:hypothetical protein